MMLEAFFLANTLGWSESKYAFDVVGDVPIGKLTPKKWAKLAKVSLDTAARDVKQLAEAGILVPGEGRFRNVPYGIVISKVWVTDSWPAYSSHNRHNPLPPLKNLPPYLVVGAIITR